MITEEQLKQNPRMAALVRKAMQKEETNQTAENTGSVLLLPIEEKANKYNVADKVDRTDADGILYASKKEMEDWHNLLLVEKAGQIKDLKRQVEFMLQEKFWSEQYGEIGHIKYVADFTYLNISYRKEYPNRNVVEDSKGGVRTPAYLLKRKLFLYKYPEWLFFEV